ncbi:MptD family putative ECF transporter S component [uncultured Desulfobacter sp.]|uniref:MptD family putative ECF transporter S component n=1 Tax=uncultured Desulfobacter sp. TaxID=240139 RepID=UPI002AAB6D3B|nr:MptD family putative ECF transporter S component [uncultured Desulfobacter sp.]
MLNPFEQHPFIPKSTQIIASGTGRDVSHLILAGIFNSLIVMLSHILYALHSLAGLFIFSYFHQAFENLFLATVYILMVIKIPGRALTINAGVWGFMGLSMGFWPLPLIILPAGIAADRFIRAWGADNFRVICAGYCFYATVLAAANGCPLLLMAESRTLARMRLPATILVPLGVTLRFMPSFIREFSHIRDALAFRGLVLSPKTVIAHPVRVTESVLIPFLLMRSLFIGEELSRAALARGFDTPGRPVSLYDIRFKFKDAAWTGLWAAGICLVLFFDRSMGGI